MPTQPLLQTHTPLALHTPCLAQSLGQRTEKKSRDVGPEMKSSRERSEVEPREPNSDKMGPELMSHLLAQHVPSEQLLPIHPALQMHWPLLHWPRTSPITEQSFGHFFIEQSKYVNPASHSHLPLTHFPCILHLFGHTVWQLGRASGAKHA